VEGTGGKGRERRARLGVGGDRRVIGASNRAIGASRSHVLGGVDRTGWNGISPRKNLGTAGLGTGDYCCLSVPLRRSLREPGSVPTCAVRCAVVTVRVLRGTAGAYAQRARVKDRGPGFAHLNAALGECCRYGRHRRHS
jgi:hypothetical protein